jgi:environmental stress-induced protein Ves
MRLLRAADRRRMPWKNGGGVTTEMAVFPESSGLDDFEWRLSMATVASDGPFSLFAGVDRTLAVLDGEGIVLSVQGMADATLTRTSPPFAFAADRSASARLISGPITDFNAMTRRGVWKHRVERLAFQGTTVLAGGDDAAIIFCASGEVAIASGMEQATLLPEDAAIVDGSHTEAAANAAAVLYLVRFTRTA